MLSLSLLAVLFIERAAALIVTPQEFVTTAYDYIVIGGGTAGLVVANRLTETPSVRVGVIEAGAYLPDDMNINLPQGSGYLGNPTYDWCFKSTPQSNVDERQIFYSRGKIVGGSSAINTMIWQRPSKAELDYWNTAFQNGPQWSFDSLLAYFKKSETWTPPALLYPGEHKSNHLASVQGFDGPINVSYNVFATDVDTPVVVSGNNLGLYTSSDQDGGNATGFGEIARSVNPVTGIRSYAANAYYGPYSTRPNLHLLTSAQVTKINFKSVDGSIVATGVNFISGNTSYTSLAKKEIVLSAGSVQTPQILELSGVGNKTLLERLGISVVLDLPQIGENLQDHPVSLTDVEVKPGVITLDQLRFNKTYTTQQWELYNTSKQGALTETASVLGPSSLQGYIPAKRLKSMLDKLNVTISEDSLTPLQRVQYGVQHEMIAGGNLGWTEFTMVPHGGLAAPATSNKSYITVVAIELHPFSRGSIHINSSNPLAPPLIDPQFLKVPFDADVLVEGTKFLQRWMQTEPVSDMVAALHTPNSTFADDDSVLQYVRQALETTNHPLGTAAMAPRSLGGVVNPQLQIYGLKNVRVVDASVIPMTLGVAIMPVVYAVAEKAADLIKNTTA